MDLAGFVIVLLIGGVLAWIFCVVTIAWSLTHPPRRGFTWALSKSQPATPAELPPPFGPKRFEAWTFRSSHGRGVFEAWDIPGDDPRGPVCIFTHGWGDSRISSLDRLGALSACCSRVIMWDMAAHADTPASRAEASPGWLAMGTKEVLDLVDLVRTVSEGERAGGRPRVVLAGFSLGAGISIAAGADDRISSLISGVIAHAPYRLPATPAESVLMMRGMPHGVTLSAALMIIGVLARQPLTWLRAGGSFDRARHASRLRCPLLVIQSEADAICPIADGREIAAAAGAATGTRGRTGGTLCVLKISGHSELWSHAEARIAGEAIGAFIRSLAPLPSVGASPERSGA